MLNVPPCLCPDDLSGFETESDTGSAEIPVTEQSPPPVDPPALHAHRMGYAVVRLRKAGAEFSEHLRNPRTGKWEKTGRRLAASGKEPMGDWRTDEIMDTRTLAAMSSYGTNCALSGVYYLDLDTKAIPEAVATTIADKRDYVISTVSKYLGMPADDLWAAVCNWTTSGGMGALFALPEGVRLGTLKGLCSGMLDTRGGWVDTTPSGGKLVQSAGQFVGPGSTIGTNPVTGWSTYEGELPPIDELPVLPASACAALNTKPERHREVVRAGREKQRQVLGRPAADPMRDLQVFREIAPLIAKRPQFDVELRHGCFNAALLCAGCYHDGATFEDALDAFTVYLQAAGDKFGREWTDASGVHHDWSIDANERLLWQAINHDAKNRSAP